jgi:hypothetical protein
MPAGDITQGYVFVPAEKNIDQVKMNAIVGNAYINPAFVSAQTASTSATTGDYFLVLKSGGTLAKIVYDDLANSLGSSTGMTSAITSVRLRSYNALASANCNFEVDQRQAGNSIAIAGQGVTAIDRWRFGVPPAATMRISAQQVATNVAVPGTSSFYITSQILRTTLTTVQASLGASDTMALWTNIEGPALRELLGDVHSVSILVRSSVASLKFGLSLQSTSGTIYTLGKLCTLAAANTWQLITLPNLPLWPAGGTWPLTPGGATAAYTLTISLAGGSSTILPANDTWQASANSVPVGISNFAASTVNSTFDLAFLQHESGPNCTTLNDQGCDFFTNLTRCQRYFAKTHNHAVKPGNPDSGNAGPTWYNTNGTSGWTGTYPFKVTMAKTPTVTCYNWNTGAANSLRASGANVTVTAVFADQDGCNSLTTSTTGTGQGATPYFTADTGW